MADQDMEKTAEEMDERLEQLEDDIDEARAKAPDAVPDATLGGASGDVGDQESEPLVGEDPEGAVDDDAS